MKNFKKIASAIAALSLAACVAVPMSATVFTASAAETRITIQKAESDTGTHAYEGYKIFSGTMQTVAGGTGEKVLVGLDWAFKTGVVETDKTDFFNALKGKWDDLSNTPTASEVAAKLGNTDFNADVEAFAGIVGQYADKLFTKITGDATGITVSEAGYYMVQDSKSPETGDKNSGAKTRYILKVVDADGTPVEVKEKAAAPTVDKQVQDETTDADTSADAAGWGETADHAIGEKFQFKLIATLPDSDEIDKYDVYKLVFNDTYSAGVDYVGESKIVITPKVGDAITVEEASFSTNVTLDHATTGKVTVTIDNLKTLMSDASLQGAKVEFIYSAKLNDKAIVHDASNGEGQLYSESDGAKVNVNYNDVYLEYSNNPNVSGGGDWDDNHGKTPKDTVGVFTYKVTNSKVDSIEKTTQLAGAKFSLYAKDPFADGNESESPIELVEVKGDDDAILGYRPKTTDDDTSVKTVTEIDTVAGQDFLFYGLDAGTYYLKEEKAPEGYNLLTEAVEIKIVAIHSEVDDTTAKLDLTGSKNMDNDIENAKGASLPSAGGIGTTLFYLGGGALVAVAGVMLITKKRMTKE